MTLAKGWLWVVFDNLRSIGRVDEHFVFRGSQNKLFGETGEDSQFEVWDLKQRPICTSCAVSWGLGLNPKPYVCSFVGLGLGLN